jgi:hypothetical protein
VVIWRPPPPASPRSRGRRKRAAFRISATRLRLLALKRVGSILRCVIDVQDHEPLIRSPTSTR